MMRRIRLLFPLLLCGLCAVPGFALAASGSSVAVGTYHSCALTNGGGVKCWGGNSSGQVGNGSQSDQFTPVFAQGLESGVTAVVAGSSHTCALTNAGAVKCWGYNAVGAVGDGTSGPDNQVRTTPVDVVGLQKGVVAIGAGAHHSCAVLANGKAKCWGSNTYGQLGLGYRDGEPVPTPALVTRVNGKPLREVASISGGDAHTCAVHTNGGLECWGRNWFGELGDGNAGVSVFREAASFVYKLRSGVVSVATGAYYTCAALADGRAKCWGWNGSGRLGNGTTTNSSLPVPVKGLKAKATAVTAAGAHTCALTDTGAAKCWGANAVGALGDGTWTIRFTPVSVNGLTNAAAIAAGGIADWAHTCAALVGGGAKCWGDDGNGQLGDGAGDSTSNIPVAVQGLN